MGFLNESGLAYYTSLIKGWVKNLIDVKLNLDIEWSPEMTSATTPSPYEVVGSSNVAGHDPYKAFDSDDNSNYQNAWASLSTASYSWIAFSFGTSTPVSGITVRARNYYSTPQIMPSAFTISGSQNGNTWTTIKECSDFNPKDDGEKYEIKFSQIVTYTWYRIYINESGCKGFNEITFLRPANSLAVVEGINSV